MRARPAQSWSALSRLQRLVVMAAFVVVLLILLAPPYASTGMDTLRTVPSTENDPTALLLDGDTGNVTLRTLQLTQGRWPRPGAVDGLARLGADAGADVGGEAEDLARPQGSRGVPNEYDRAAQLAAQLDRLVRENRHLRERLRALEPALDDGPDAATPAARDSPADGRGGGSEDARRPPTRLRDPNGPDWAIAHNPQQAAVVAALRWAWSGYKKYAWGKDELLPVSMSSSNWLRLGLTIVESLDTLLVMGLREDFREARDWVEQHLDFDVDVDVNVFETTIRVLGGLLSAYHLTGDRMLLAKAAALGDRLLPAFQTASGVPVSDVNLHTRVAHGPKWGPDSSTSEATSVQLEFRDLSFETGDPRFRAAADRVIDVVANAGIPDGLLPIWVNPDTGLFKGGVVTLGARGDSYYEYLLKQWLQTDKTEPRFLALYETAVRGIMMKLKGVSEPSKLVFIGELVSGHFSPKMDHLVCFLAGLLALGTANGLPESHRVLGEQLAYTCWQMYERMPTGLAPEIAHFRINPTGPGDDVIVKPSDAHNLLRPETVESLFVLWRVTRDTRYREWGWKIFQAIERHARVASGGYSSVQNVLAVPPGFRNKMESFFCAETLKYLYLLFDDDPHLLPLDRWVFNTEAHALPIRRPH